MDIRNWTAALSLEERRFVLQEDIYASAEAIKLAEAWRNQAPFPQWWPERLAQAHLTEDHFLLLLDPPPAPAVEPDWLITAHECFNTALLPYPSWLPQPSLLELVWPFVSWAYQCINQRYLHVPFDWQQLYETLTHDLAQYLTSLLGPTLALELHNARVNQSLVGEDSEARFVDFVMIWRSGLLTYLMKYPPLLRLLVETCQTWILACHRLFERLDTDWPTLKTFFKLHNATSLIEIIFQAGDQHAGESVSILKFSYGERIVYKPQSLAVMTQFRKLVDWLNQYAAIPTLRLPHVLERSEYGWVEWIEAVGCDSEQQVHRFYQRHGAFLVLWMILHATDMHYENWIAAGEYPVPIDLEAVCQPQLGNAQPALFRVGVLPHRVLSGQAAGSGVDLSGFGGSPDQPLAVPSLQWQNINQDTMALRAVDTYTEAAQNLPKVADQTLAARQYESAIVAGFQAAYTAVLNHRDLVWSLLEGFADLQVRCVMRPSEHYAILLRHAVHPSRLRNAVERDRLFDRLWLAVKYQPWLLPVIQVEQADLRKQAIPWFATRPRSDSLWTKSGREIPQALAIPSWVAIQATWQQLSQDHCVAQIDIIRHALTGT